MTYIIIYVTCESADEAERIAGKLLEGKLIACANILPEHSAVFHWEGDIQSEKETAMILKSREDLFEEIRETICQHHSYDVPCIVAMPIMQANKAFLRFIEDETNELRRP